MRAAIYTRVSHELQVSDGFSLDAQLNRLRSFADSQGWSIADIYTDEGISAKNTERPGLQRMLNDIRERKIDVVLVYKLDRLTRNVVDLHELLQVFEQYGVGFKSASEVFDTTTAIGRLFLTIVAAMAQWEREQLSERTAMGLREMTKQGRWSGGKVPYGYRNENHHLVVYEPEAVVIRELFRRYVDGQGMPSLLQWLNDPDDPQPSHGEKWTQTNIKYILRNPLYAGKVRFGYRKVNGKRNQNYMVENGIHDAIIPWDLYEQSERVRMRRRTNPGNNDTGNYPLSGLLRCGKCGSAMNGRTKYKVDKQNSPPRRYYLCNTRSLMRLCDMPFIKADELEAKVLELISEYATSLPTTIQEPRPLVDITAELGRINRQRERWRDAFRKEDIESSVLREELATLDREEIELRQMYERDQETTNPNEIRELMKNLHENWEEIEAPERKEILRMFISRIELQPDGGIVITYRE